VLKAGAVVLSIWSGINLLLAAFILVLVVFFGEQARLLLIIFSGPEVSAHDLHVLSTVRSLVVLFNASIAAASLLALFIIWSALIHGQSWAFWALLISLGVIQLFGFTADAPLVFRTVLVNSILTALYVSGIGLAGYAIHSR
jgi:hypothetical protein